MFVDVGHSVMAGAMEETFLVVLMAVSLLHVTLLDLQAFPQYRVLDPLDLKEGKFCFALSYVFYIIFPFPVCNIFVIM